ncbi:hypothetical protein [Paenarthrobacter sp. NPDC058040]|uniref:hypothetical protein n=1 Tax=unclassified Paenarthrobacter TaxID=2634190 RepID=UPI0036DC593A
MRAGRGLLSTTAIAAACLMFGCWVVGCTPDPAASPGAAAPTATVQTAAATPPAETPAPSGPSASDPPVSPAPVSTAASSTPDAPYRAAPAPAASSTTPAPTDSRAGPASGTPTQGQGPTPTPGAAVGPSTIPSTSPSAPAAQAAAAQPPAELGPAVYYVAINDGGSRGVRFGCNDSLVAVRGAASSGDALTVALGRLLGAGMPLDNEAALYDSLAASSLHFVSGYVSGSTVVVNLGGSLRPGGVCDIPRIEAQLTHTVVSASGATRAEIYINGMTLEVALSLR